MATGNSFAEDVLDLLLRATAIANIADNAASAPITDTYLSLHTANPADTGDQTTSEAAYTSYARKAVARSTGWGASVNGVSTLAANNDFVAATGGSETETHAMCGKSSSGAGVNFFNGTVTPNIIVSTGVTPRLTSASTITLT
jgi:hypothetical protein